MPITYNNLYMDIRQALKGGGVTAATMEARELVCCASGKSREELMRDGQLYAPPEVEKKARELMERHLNGEPVAYLIGEWEFYGMPLDISEAVLIPRVDTEVLVDEVIRYLGDRECRVLDLCAGSGCIGLAVAANCRNARVLLGEISEPAIRICRQNIRRNQLTGRVTVMPMDAKAAPARALGEFDCIVSNPPYIPTKDIEGLDISVKGFEPHLALCGGVDGYDFYCSIIGLWKEALKPGGRLYFEVGIGQADTVLRMMRGHGFGDVNIVEDTAGIPRVVYGTLITEI